MDKIKKTTIQDVADHANVSVGTVDRVIHRRGKVSLAKKEKVEEAITALDFNPNLLARTLALGKHFVICSLFPETLNDESYWSLPAKGLKQSAFDYRDFGIAIESSQYSLFNEQSFVENAKKILDLNPDGVILAPLFEKESLLFIKELEKKRIPYIFIDANIANQNNLSYIGPDSKGSGHLAGKFMSFLLEDKDPILVINMVKGLQNSAHVSAAEKGFFDFFEKLDSSNGRKICSLTIPSVRKEDVVRELTKYYIGNRGTKGVFVTNSKAHLISEFHREHELDIKLIGFDLVEGNIREMRNGSIDFLISQSPIFQAYRAVQQFFDFFVYKNSPAPLEHVPLDIIAQENIEYYLNSRQLIENHKKQIK